MTLKEKYRLLVVCGGIDCDTKFNIVEADEIMDGSNVDILKMYRDIDRIEDKIGKVDKGLMIRAALLNCLINGFKDMVELKEILSERKETAVANSLSKVLELLKESKLNIVENALIYSVFDRKHLKFMQKLIEINIKELRNIVNSNMVMVLVNKANINKMYFICQDVVAESKSELSGILTVIKCDTNEWRKVYESKTNKFMITYKNMEKATNELGLNLKDFYIV